MKISYKTLNTNGDVIATLGKTKIKDFGTKIKVVKLNTWLQEEAEILGKFAKEIEDEFNVKENFEFNEAGDFIGENKEELIKVINLKREREAELFKVEIDLVDICIEEAELEDLELTAEEILKLVNLGLFKI